MFEIATRKKFRFPYKGIVSTEDLWDLSIQQLDSIYKTLNAKVKQANEDSLLSIRSVEDTDINTMIDIVKYIVKVKVEEADARKLAVARREQKQRIMEILASKQDEILLNKSPEDLQKMLDELN